MKLDVVTSGSGEKDPPWEHRAMPVSGGFETERPRRTPQTRVGLQELHTYLQVQIFLSGHRGLVGGNTAHGSGWNYMTLKVPSDLSHPMLQPSVCPAGMDIHSSSLSIKCNHLKGRRGGLGG